MKYLVVSIHDAAPPHLERLKKLTQWLDRHSVRPRCIKVIPNFLGKWNILGHSEFLDWLQSEKEKGSEFIQHGFLHLKLKKEKGLRFRFQEKFITRDQAEFQNMSYSEAMNALGEGKEILLKAGLSCSGFTSPTWFQSKAAFEAIKDSGYSYFTSHSFLFDCRKEKYYFSLAMGFQGVNPLLEYLAMAGNTIMRHTGLFCTPLSRLVLHPPSTDGSRPFLQALKDILALMKKRELVTYSQYLKLIT
ncbi:MAG: DUF2334 domain-containing protein [Candidatus Aminicenantales bacterium]